MSADKKIGPYHIQRPVSRWTLAERFLAKENGEGPSFLLDRLWPELKNLHGFGAEVEHISSWKQVNNPAIPAVVDVHQGDAGVSIISQTFEGRSLESLLQRQLQSGTPLPKRLVLELGIQISRALSAIHEATDEEGWSLALTHSAVTPSRVMLDKKGRVRLIGGWGSRLEARLNFSQTSRNIVYTAPEVLWGSSPSSARSDLFALGVMLYEGWSLKRFEGTGEDGITTLRRILKRSPAAELASSGVDAQFIEILSALLDPSPENRPQSAREVLDSLSAFLPSEAQEPEKAASAQAAAPPKAAPPKPAPAKPRPAPGTPLTEAADPPSVKLPVKPVPSEASQARAEMVATTVINQAEMRQAAENAIAASKDIAQTEELQPKSLVAQELAATQVQENKDQGEKVAPSPAKEVEGDKKTEKSAAPETPTEAKAPAAAPEVAKQVEDAPAPEPKASEAAPSAPAKAEQPSVAPSALDGQGNVAATQESSISSEPPPVQKAAPEAPPVTYTQEQRAISPLILQQEFEEGALWGFLVYREGSSEERRYALSGTSVSLGRSSDNQYQILREIKASRRHCMFEFDGGQVFVTDRRSTNGTHVNGQPITRAEIHGGEKLTIGYTTLKLLLVDEDGNEIGAAKKLELGTTDISKPLPKAFLTRFRHSDKEQIIPIEGEVFMIGRNKDMDLTLKDRKVAPSHCQIRVEGNQYVFEDHLSEHGTLINGFLVDQIILDGNEDIQIGDQNFQFEVMRDHQQ